MGSDSVKLCECGCGKPAPIATQTAAKFGRIKGQPMRFIVGHNGRVMPRGAASPQWKGGRRPHNSGYIMVYAPDHPRANNVGSVLEHILICERALGRYLPPQAEVHHVNEVKDENRNSNLVICEDRAYHQLLHRRVRAYRATGNPLARKCYMCKQWGGEDLRLYDRDAVHGACVNAYQRQLYHSRRNES